MSKEDLEKTEQINKETDINEVLVALYEAELRYNQEYERIRYEEETLRKIPDLKSKMSLVELECKYNHLIRRYKVELERIKKGIKKRGIMRTDMVNSRPYLFLLLFF